MTTRFDRLTLLETFLRIAERRSLSAAARDMGTSQPSVSRQLIALENHLGVTLIRRTTHDLTLTPDGLRLLTDARRLLGEWQAVAEGFSANGMLSGTIRVIAPVALGQTLLIDAAAGFLKDHPYMTIDWRLRDDPIRFAEEGCDCWIKVGAIPDDTLFVRQLARIERIVVGTPECLANHKGVDLEAMPWITLGPFEGNRIELFDMDGSASIHLVNPRLASDNIFAVHATVMRGAGIAIMPHWFVGADLDRGTLMDAAPGLKARSLPLNLAIAAGTKRPARVEQFCFAIEEWCRTRLAPSAG